MQVPIAESRMKLAVHMNEQAIKQIKGFLTCCAKIGSLPSIELFRASPSNADNVQVQARYCSSKPRHRKCGGGRSIQPSRAAF